MLHLQLCSVLSANISQVPLSKVLLIIEGFKVGIVKSLSRPFSSFFGRVLNKLHSTLDRTLSCLQSGSSWRSSWLRRTGTQRKGRGNQVTEDMSSYMMNCRGGTVLRDGKQTPLHRKAMINRQLNCKEIRPRTLLIWRQLLELSAGRGAGKSHGLRSPPPWRHSEAKVWCHGRALPNKPRAPSPSQLIEKTTV